MLGAHTRYLKLHTNSNLLKTWIKAAEAKERLMGMKVMKQNGIAFESTEKFMENLVLKRSFSLLVSGMGTLI